MQIDLTTIIAALIAGICGSGGVWVAMTQAAQARARAPADLTAAQAAFQEALGRQSEAFQKSMMTLISHMQGEIDGLRSEVGRLSKAEQDCNARNAALEQNMRSLVHLLRDQGFDVPGDLPLDRLHITREGGVTMFQGRPIAKGAGK